MSPTAPCDSYQTPDVAGWGKGLGEHTLYDKNCAPHGKQHITLCKKYLTDIIQAPILPKACHG